jgi:hypothetical protein
MGCDPLYINKTDYSEMIAASSSINANPGD